MNAPKSQHGSWRILSLPLLLLLVATLLSAGVAFAGLAPGDHSGIAAQPNAANRDASNSSGTTSAINVPAATATAPACPPGWTIYPNPAPSGESTLHAVTAFSPTDLWSVGEY